ncbi:MAG: T9SS type A sorting domain-containing protein, partial [Chlamydiia bacterium]|nr:T9SS type A sorting domain-containing protein [Chlamydiia bacterium]
HANNIDAAIVMAEGEPKPNAWGDMSVIVRFTKGGTFDARDGGAYNADNAISYTAGTTYVITMDVDVAGSTYSVTIAEKGTAVTTELATDYAFRKTPVAELNTVYFPAVTWSYTYKDVTPYALTVEYGTSDQPAGDVVAGTLVTITAEVAAEGMKFDKWITSEGVTLADATADVTTFTMLAEAVTVTATYIEDEELSISENFESSFNVYPNPVNNGVLNIQAIGNVSNLVTITNLVGQEVFTAEFSGNSTQVSTSSFTKGMYFVTLKSGNNVSTKRVIIE